MSDVVVVVVDDDDVFTMSINMSKFTAKSRW